MRGQRGKPPEDPDQPKMPVIGNGDGTLSFGPIHDTFIADTSEQIDLEGARFSGKTWACCAKVIYSCRAYPGIVWQICRYSDEDSQKLLKPVFLQVCHHLGEYPDWNAESSAYVFANHSVVRVRGLRSQGKLATQAKVRGVDVAGIWVDQSEELPEEIGTELPFGTRQPGYPHQVIFSPNPPPEECWLADWFPDDNSITGRKYYRVSLYDNPNCPENKLAELERLYSPTHARYKTLVLGLRGPSAVGTPIYDNAFLPELHHAPLTYNPELPLLQAVQMGQQHPVWIVAQRNYFGGIEVLGGILGKRLFLENFLPIVEAHRSEWFPDAKLIETYCDPPPSKDAQSLRFTNLELLRVAKWNPRFTVNGNAPDVREAVIQSIFGFMHRRLGRGQAFVINNDPKRWLMASHLVVKQSKFFIDGVQANYVWDENMVSVGNKLHRQPKANEWVEGAQRCLENLVLNCWATHLSDAERDERRRLAQQRQMDAAQGSQSPHSWLSW